MEEQIKMAKLNAEFSKKQNDLKARKQMVENLKHTRLQHVDEEYHEKKRELLSDIADLRKQKEGRRLDELLDEEKVKVMEELNEEGRRLDELLDEEKFKVMEEQYAAKIAKEAAQAEEGGNQ